MFSRIRSTGIIYLLFYLFSFLFFQRITLRRFSYYYPCAKISNHDKARRWPRGKRVIRKPYDCTLNKQYAVGARRSDRPGLSVYFTVLWGFFCFSFFFRSPSLSLSVSLSPQNQWSTEYNFGFVTRALIVLFIYKIYITAYMILWVHLLKTSMPADGTGKASVLFHSNFPIAIATIIYIIVHKPVRWEIIVFSTVLLYNNNCFTSILFSFFFSFSRQHYVLSLFDIGPVGIYNFYSVSPRISTKSDGKLVQSSISRFSSRGRYAEFLNVQSSGN